MRRLVLFAIVGTFTSACGSESEPSPTTPTASTTLPATPASAAPEAPGSELASMSVGFDSGFAVQSVAFPSRDEPIAFRRQLDGVYQNQLRRATRSTFVDMEGSTVWIQEYLRYRLSGCGHAQAAQFVLSEIDGAAAPADCGGSVAFPPRNEPFDFRANTLEPKYRDGLRRPPVSTFVDDEGDSVWTTEYLRYRVSGCSHDISVQLVQVQVSGVPPTNGCGATLNPAPAPSPVTSGSMSAQIDGRSLNSTGGLVSARYAAGFFVIRGADISTAIFSDLTFGVPASGPGTYAVGDASATNAVYSRFTVFPDPSLTWKWVAGAGVGSGTVTFTRLTSAGASGTFSFNLTALTGTSATGTVAVTDGTFSVDF